MNKKKLFVVVGSFALVIAMTLSGALAVSDDQEPGVGTAAADASTSALDAEEAPAVTQMPEHEKAESPAKPETPAKDEMNKEASQLFDKIMACKTLDEIWAVFDGATDKAVDELTDKQNAQIDAKIASLEPAPAPAVVVERSDDETVPSEIVYPTVNYTYVAPFVEPVTGGHQ